MKAIMCEYYLALLTTYLFYPNGICLWLAILSQFKALVVVECLGQRAMTALTKQNQFGMKFHSALKGRLGRAIFSYPNIHCSYALNTAIFMVQYLQSRIYITCNATCKEILLPKKLRLQMPMAREKVCLLRLPAHTSHILQPLDPYLTGSYSRVYLHSQLLCLFP